MAAKFKTVVDTARVADIHNALRAECAKFASADIDRANATDARNDAIAEGQSIRETVMGDIARLSRDNAWREAEVKAACKALKAGDNSQTLVTFMSEIMNVAHPNVRDQFNDLVSLRDALWPADADPELNPVNPDVAKCWNRRYHMLTQMTRVVRKGEGAFNGVEDVIEYARNNNPDEDPEKVQKKLEKIAETLGDMFLIFPDEDLKLASEYVAGIDAKKLIAARATIVSPGVVVPVKPERPLIAPKNTTTVGENTPAPGAVDIEDLLGDKPAHLISAAA